MNNAIEGFILPLVGIILTVIAAVYSLNTANNITKLSEYNTNEDLKLADVFISSSQIILWISAIIFLILLIMHLTAEDLLEKWLHVTLLFLNISLLVVAIIFIGLTIDYIGRSNVDLVSQYNNRASKDAVTALLLTIGTTVVAFIMIIFRGTDKLYEKEVERKVVIERSEIRYE